MGNGISSGSSVDEVDYYQRQLEQATTPADFQTKLASFLVYMFGKWLEEKALDSELNLVADGYANFGKYFDKRIINPANKLATIASREHDDIGEFVGTMIDTVQDVTDNPDADLQNALRTDHWQNFRVLLEGMRGHWGPDVGEVFRSAGLLDVGEVYGRNQTQFNAVIPRVVDPLIVDLDGDGVEADLLAAPSTYFDLDGDGLAEAVSWVNGDDGIVARDVNGNGVIDNGSEVFGTGRDNGFAALALLDDNGDGRIDAGDAGFTSLRIWKDANRDGTSDPGELLTLAARGITQIDVAHYETVVGGSGRVSHIGQAIATSGQAMQVANALFVTDLQNTQYRQAYQLDLRTIFLPTLRGYGTLPSLHVAMSLDNGDGADTLLSKVVALTNHSVTQLLTHWYDVEGEFQQILFRWAQVETLAPNSRGEFVDAREVAFLEAYMGQAFVAANFTGTGQLTHPGSRQGTDLHDLFEETADRLLGHALTQTVFVSVFDDAAIYDLAKDTGRTGNEAGAVLGNTRLSQDVLAQLTQKALALPDTPTREAFWLGLIRMIHDMQVSSGVMTAANGVALGLDEAALNAAIIASDATLSWYNEDNDPVHGHLSIEHRYYNPAGETTSGSAAADVLTGTAFDDNISGDSGGDHLSGGDGDDQIFGHSKDGISDDGAADWLDGGYGKDYMDGGGGNDTIYAFDGDVAIGGDGSDFISASGTSERSTQNYLDGGSGNDTYVAGFGRAETFIADGGGSDVVETLFNEIVRFLRFGPSTLLVELSNPAHTMFAEVFLVDQLAEGHGIETLILGNGVAVDLRAFLAGWTQAIPTQGSAAADEIHGISGVGNVNDLVYAYAGDDRIWGDDGDDALIGAAGDDSLRGGDGNDYVEGGQGNDNGYGDAGNDTLFMGAGDDIAYGGEGNDYITAEGRSRIYGGSGDDLVIAQGGAGEFHGDGGNDSLIGNSQDDVFFGGAGDDMLDGGASERFAVSLDTVSYDDATSRVVVDLDRGIADGNSSGHDVLTSIEVVIGSAYDDALTARISENARLYGGNGDDVITGGRQQDRLYGDSGQDRITAGDGNDTLDGGEGNDWLDGGTGSTGDILTGGTGNDTLVVDTVDDTVMERPGEGTDTVRSSVTWILGVNFEHLELYGDVGVNGTGNAVDNRLIGNAAANVLIGLGGHDWIDGGNGIDTMIGGLGDDSYVIESSEDMVMEKNGEGRDTVMSSVTYSIRNAYVEVLTLTGNGHIGGTGNGLANLLQGNAGNNRLDGSAGADTMAGGIGDDTYIIDDAGDVVVELEGSGNDTVQTVFTTSLAVGLENLILTATAALNGTGNANANGMTGNLGDNMLSGLGGDDRLDGGKGNDTMTGGLGDDIFVVDALGDFVAERNGEGRDTVTSSVTWSMRNAYTEVLSLTGTSNISATGNGLANVLNGNGGANTLNGAAGDDTMAGGAGGDFYVVDDAGDVVIEAANQGIDTVQSSVSYALGDNVENLTLAGTAAIDGTGNGLSNTMIGTSGNNILNGGSGIDRMYGRGGNDTYIVDNSADGISEYLAGRDAGGIDTVLASVSFTLKDFMEGLTLTGTGNINAVGNGLSNTISGNAGRNYIDGKGGNDLLSGGAGQDQFVFGMASGFDRIVDFSTAQNDRINVHALSNGVAHGGGIVLSQVGGDTIIQLGGGNVITVVAAIAAEVDSHMIW